jgi:hypothetical protein
VTTEEAKAMTRRLALEEGLLTDVFATKPGIFES